MKPVSLRWTALVWMTALLTVVGGAGAIVAYAFTYSSVSELLDGHLQQVAMNVGGGVRVTDTTPRADDDPEDVFAVAIFTQAGPPTYTTGPRLALPAQSPGFIDVEAKGELWRVYTAGAAYPIVQVAQQWTVRREIARNAALTTAAPVLLVIPLSWIVVGWAMGKALRRLDALVAEISARGTNADTPIDATGAPLEITPLVESLNGLIARLGAAVSAQKRFVADAAHELRTPLAALQIQVDILRSERREKDASPIIALARGVSRATSLTNQLLSLARLDDATPPQLTLLDLAELLTTSVAEMAPMANAKDVDLGLTQITPASCFGAEPEVRALFGNLIENAVKYTAAGGQVDVSLRAEGETATVDIVDTGPGIPTEATNRIFERFYRADTAQCTATGSGLGLAIAKQVAGRHQFFLSVVNRTDGNSGVRARVMMRLAQTVERESIVRL